MDCETIDNQQSHNSLAIVLFSCEFKVVKRSLIYKVRFYLYRTCILVNTVVYVNTFHYVTTDVLCMGSITNKTKIAVSYPSTSDWGAIYNALIINKLTVKDKTNMFG